ncbi:MAG: ABC transporter ATP-binding protein [Candidatus Rokubacteria bacterium]|nr:ABC transporter ATP-binding protein [Candidatus Rokubacteria bacterium]
MTALALAGVQVLYGGVPALAVDALDVREAEVLAVIGPNGSGKSTLLRVLGLLERPTAGEVRFRDRVVDARSALAERRRMAIVFQQPLLADMTVAANVALGLRFRGVPAADRDARVARWLDRFGVAALAERRARALSGGEAQRVALARALAVEPAVLLLDEPFAALDEPARVALIEDLAAIVRADRVTTVLVTHDRGEARALADRVAVLLGGRLEQLDDTARVFSAPVSATVARFVGVETIVPGEVVTSADGVARVVVGGQVLEVASEAAAGARVRVCIRPEDVTLVPASEPVVRSSARNHLAGTIATVTPTASHVRVVVDCGFPLIAAVTARSIEELALAPGAPVTAVFKASAAHLLADRS